MSSFWRKGVRSFRLKRLTDYVIQNAEAKLGVTLPKSYLKILEEQNGGYITANAFPTNEPTAWADNHVRVDHIRGIGKKNGILESGYLIKEWDLPSKLVLISGDGHAWIALDYRTINENPKVIYFDAESGKTIVLAESFDEFLKGLYIEEDGGEHEEEFDYEEAMRRNFNKDWSPENIANSLASNVPDDVISVFNYMMKHPNPKEHVPSIESALFRLLNESDKHLREIGALYAHHFKTKKILSKETRNKLREIVRQDEELSIYTNYI